MAFNPASVTPGRLGMNPFASKPSLAGLQPASLFGSADYEAFQKAFQNVPENQRDAFMNWSFAQTLMAPTLMQLTPEWREKELEMQEKLATKRGWKSAMFNTLTSGMENLTRGIGMSFNPYGTPEAARYSADMIATTGDRMANAYAAVRNPMNIPAVTPPGAISYF